MLSLSYILRFWDLGWISCRSYNILSLIMGNLIYRISLPLSLCVCVYIARMREHEGMPTLMPWDVFTLKNIYSETMSEYEYDPILYVAAEVNICYFRELSNIA